MLTKDNTGLIIVDVQGKLAEIVCDSSLLIANIVKLIKGAHALNLPIIWLEQNPEKLGQTVPQLREVLAPIQPLTKFTFSGCKEQSFTQALQDANINTWLVCGIETHICVYQTVMDLTSSGINIELVCDCVSSRSPFNRDLAISKMATKGITMTSLEMCLYELVGDCRAGGFRDILRLIK